MNHTNHPPTHQVPAANFKKCSVHFTRGPCLIWQGGWLLSFCLKRFFSHMFWVKPITTCHQFASMHPITYSSDQTPNPETTSPEFVSRFFFDIICINIYIGSFCLFWFSNCLKQIKTNSKLRGKIRILRFRIGCLTWWTSLTNIYKRPKWVEFHPESSYYVIFLSNETLKFLIMLKNNLKKNKQKKEGKY